MTNNSRFKASACTNCKRMLDAASKNPRKPRPGDMTICLYCGHLMTFGKRLVLREPTDDELIDVAGGVQLITAQRVRAMYLREIATLNRHSRPAAKSSEKGIRWHFWQKAT